MAALCLTSVIHSDQNITNFLIVPRILFHLVTSLKKETFFCVQVIPPGIFPGLSTMHKLSFLALFVTLLRILHRHNTPSPTSAMANKRQPRSFKSAKSLSQGSTSQGRAYVARRKNEVAGVRERWNQQAASRSQVNPEPDNPPPEDTIMLEAAHAPPPNAPDVDEANMTWEDVEDHSGTPSNEPADPVLLSLNRAGAQARNLAHQNKWNLQLAAMFKVYLVAKEKTANWSNDKWDTDCKATCSCSGRALGMREVVFIDYESTSINPCSHSHKML